MRTDYIIRYIPTGIKTITPKRGGRIEVQYTLKDKNYDNPIK